jgi:glycosyltransferase involved in cell wall biosynthesis
MNVEQQQKVAIIMPAYNESGSIGDVLDRLMPMASERHWTVLVIDDGSDDGSGSIAKTHGATVITHPGNRGYGASMVTGVKAARDAEVVVLMDSDGQHDENDIPRLLEHTGDHDMVVGARTKESYVDIQRVAGKKILKWFANYLAKEDIPDLNSGFRAFRRDALLSYLHLMPPGFSFSTTSTFAMIKGGHHIKWIPITTKKRIGSSSVSQLRDGPQTMMLMLRLTVLFDPLRAFLPVSGASFVLAVVMTLLNILFYRRAIPASAVLFGITGVIVFLLGLLTDQVAAIRRDQHIRL